MKRLILEDKAFKNALNILSSKQHYLCNMKRSEECTGQGREQRIVANHPWFPTKKEAGGWEMLIMFQALYLLTYFIFTVQVLSFYRSGIEGPENQNYSS